MSHGDWHKDLKPIVEWESHWHSGLHLTVAIGVAVLLSAASALIKGVLTLATVPIWGPVWLLGWAVKRKIKDVTPPV